jgi:solute carrier family 25 iron transporter 28/37
MSSDSSSSFDDEWEEWDGKTPFWSHCVAGSLAGVAEHTLVYPLDTVRTHIQVCGACHHSPSSSKAASGSSSMIGKPQSLLQKAAMTNTNDAANMGMWQTMRQLMSQPLAFEGGTAASGSLTAPRRVVGATRLWRGVHTILIGCIPAHALYFSSYEMVKAATLDSKGQVTTYGSALAGGVAVVSHDIILGPLDTVKQRLQLGHYRGLSHALSTMIANEGFVSLYRSFPVTLATNIPYGMVMVGVNEFCKQQWTADGEPLTLGVTLAASSLAGLTASALTTPLDRIKTYLQTQQLTPACSLTASAPPDHCPLTKGNNNTAKGPIVADWRQAALRIYRTEGAQGFFRGMTPRILSHTPAVAISWTTYETAKQYLSTIDW